MRFLDANKGSIVRWEESVRFAVWALAVDKVKASLTMLGVVIGSAAIVLVVTIASTGKVYMISQIEGIGSNLAYASLDRAGTTTNVPEDELTPGDLSAARQALPGVRAVAGTYDLPVDLQLKGRAFHPRLVGVTQDFESIRNLRVISGRYFDRDDFLSRFKVCLVTDRLVQAAFGPDSAVGNTIQIGQFRCTVIGIFTEGVPLWSARFQSRCPSFGTRFEIKHWFPDNLSTGMDRVDPVVALTAMPSRIKTPHKPAV